MASAMASFLEHPTSFRVRELAATLASAAFTSNARRSIADQSQAPFIMADSLANATVSSFANITILAEPHSAHPDFLHLAGLVCEAVLEVVFVALPGFLAAWSGMFTAENQKFAAELNTMVFTPCLIFTKLASQLNADMLMDLAVIPIIFVAQTIVSYLSAHLMARLWGFGGREKRRQRSFIIAMGVFGNSNSLPISLVLSLSKTIAGLHWDKIPGDNDDEVGARGILYLLIFQQLGQVVRWTWGYNVLLKPKSAFEEEDRAFEEAQQGDRIAEEGRYRDEPDLLDPAPGKKPTDSGFGSGSQTPVSSISSASSEDSEPLLIGATPSQGNNISTEPRNLTPTSSKSHSTPNGTLYERARSTGHITTFPNFSQTRGSHLSPTEDGSRLKRTYHNILTQLRTYYNSLSASLAAIRDRIFSALPIPLQKVLTVLNHYWLGFWAGVRRQMNPPLWAMLAALIVASIPALQRLFFTHGTLINNSVTRAIQQSGGVAVPLILVVLGANLARSTLPKDQLATSPEEKKEERRLLFASLLSRMVLPTIVMAPFLALMAKYVPVSILDDPIFIIVCFLLTGAPSALQLAQICQINEVFMGAMSSLLVASYVIAIFPSTLTLVLLALEVVEWAVL